MASDRSAGAVSRVPTIPDDVDPELGWTSEGPHRPTKAWVHECGSRAARWEQGETNARTVYHCPECDVTRPIATSYGFEEVLVDA